MIAERYKREFGIDPVVVMNAPSPVSVPDRELDPANVRLIYQGCAMRERQLEVMIRALSMCDRRYSLHFMMTGYDAGYFEELERLSAEVAPGRVSFRDPVLPDKVAEVISEYDVGFIFHRPINYNYLAALPNKFFECIVAGLPVCAGPSPSIAEIVRAHGLGCVAPSFEPRAFADTLNALTTEDLVRMREAARRAARQINADVEMGKVVEMHRSLLAAGERGA
jgi:glycosyltransferase involved in cell wall biosynthesis